MATYLILNIVFMAAVMGLFRLRPSLRPVTRLAPLLALLLLTLLFDNLMIRLHIFTYNPKRISGVRVGSAPLEDFAYPILAFVVLPLLWEYFNKKRHDV